MAILGDNSDGGNGANGNPDRAWLTRFTATEDGSINSAGAYFNSSSSSGSSAKVIVYTAAGTDTPGTLVASSSASAVPAGGGLVTFTMSGSFTAGDYFIGVVHSDFQGIVNYDSGLSGMETELLDGTLSYASPPASAPAPSASYNTSRVNVYLDYTASGGATTRGMPFGLGSAFGDGRTFVGPLN